MKQSERKKLLSRWAPMPRYLLRRWVVRVIVSRLRPRDFIEIGAATGEMAEWLSRKDIRGVAVEISPPAIEMLQARIGDDPDIQIYTQDARELSKEADLLLSMEVLEHLEDDHDALRSWHRLIRPGGHVLLSVPAGQHLFSVHDDLVGHYRRYDKQELIDKLRMAGFDNPQVLSYGFPVSFILRRIRNTLAKKSLRKDKRSVQQRTEASGVERQWVGWLRWMLNDFFFLPLQLIQMPFLRLDWTDGYIAIARKPM